MRLIKLELNGFKSFAKKTQIDIERGVTAIIGPNGSGKSNIADAVRWVLGEQSAKALRGAKMEDVIFNGTESRKPQAFCEVTLTFDNADGELPTDYAEVSITRRVYRSGESEYLTQSGPLQAQGHPVPAAGYGGRQGRVFHHRPGQGGGDPVQQVRRPAGCL